MMGGFSLWHWIILLAMLAAFVALVRWAYSSAKKVAGSPVGVGGWLVLPIIGFVGVIVLTLINIIGALSEFEGLKTVFTATDGPLRQLQLPVGLSMIFGIAVICSSSFCLFKIFASKKDPRSVAVVHYVLLAAAGFVDLWADSALTDALPDTPHDPTAIKEAVRGVFMALIWIPYFLISKRVRNTFQNNVTSVATGEAV
jgi:Protein of unknown function (DUF2569)